MYSLKIVNHHSNPSNVVYHIPQQAEVAKSSRSGIEIYNGEVALLQIEVMITSLEVALSQKYLHIFLYKSIMWSSNK